MIGIIGISSVNYASAIPSLNLTENAGQANPPFTIYDSNNNPVFRIASNGQITFVNTPLNQIGVPTSSFSFNNQRLISLGSPILGTDAARANTIGNQVLSFNASPTNNQVLTIGANGTAVWATNSAAGNNIRTSNIATNEALLQRPYDYIVVNATHNFMAINTKTGASTNSTDLPFLVNSLLQPNKQVSIYVNVNIIHNMPTTNLPFKLNETLQTLIFSKTTQIYVTQGYTGDVFLIQDQASAATNDAHLSGGIFWEDGTPQKLWTCLHLQSWKGGGVAFNHIDDMICEYPKIGLLMEAGGSIQPTEGETGTGGTGTQGNSSANYVNGNIFTNFEVGAPSEAVIKWIGHANFTSGSGYINGTERQSSNNYFYKAKLIGTCGTCVASTSTLSTDPASDPTHWVIAAPSGSGNFDQNVFFYTKAELTGAGANVIADTNQYGTDNQFYGSIIYDVPIGGRGVNIENSASNTIFLPYSGFGTRVLDQFSPSSTYITNRTPSIFSTPNILVDNAHDALIDSVDVTKFWKFNLGKMSTGVIFTIQPRQTITGTLNIPSFGANGTLLANNVKNNLTSINDFGVGNGKLTNDTFSTYGFALRDLSDNFAVQLLNNNNNGHNYTLAIPALSANSTIATTSNTVTTVNGLSGAVKIVRTYSNDTEIAGNSSSTIKISIKPNVLL
jgi:hypothetical protein